MKYFTDSEFACKCGCGFTKINHELGQVLDAIREFFDIPCHVTSGCRCEAYNLRVGGAMHSQHLLGNAADIWFQDIKPAYVAEVAVRMGATGTKVYETFTHVDVRDGKPWHVF